MPSYDRLRLPRTGHLVRTSSFAALSPLLATVVLAGLAAACSGSSAQFSNVPPAAVRVPVEGGPLTAIASAPLSLEPNFSPATHDYVMYCPAGGDTVSLQMSSTAGHSLVVGDERGKSVTATVQLVENQAAVVSAHGDQYWIRCLPHDFPHLAVARPRPRPPGWYVTGNLTAATRGTPSSPYVMVLDQNGTPVWYRRTTTGVVNATLLPNETIAWIEYGTRQYNLYNLATGASSSLSAGTAGPLVGGEESTLPTDTDGRELLQLPNGNLMVLATPVRTGMDLSSLGGQFSSLTSATVVDCVVQEVTPQGTPVWTWHASESIGPDESTNPQAVSVGGTIAYNLYNCNSIDVDPADPNPETANVLISAANTNAVYEIDRSTGNIIWKLGGTTPSPKDPDSDAVHLTTNDDPEGGFYNQHDARFEPNSDVSLFDDHTGKLAPARAVEYHVDTSMRSASLVWQYQQYWNRLPYNSLDQGSFRRYDNNNDNVIGWGANTSPTGLAMTEADGVGHVLMTITLPDLEQLYRIVKFPEDSLSAATLRQNMGGLGAR